MEAFEKKDRVVTIWGSPGVGKTIFAKHIALSEGTSNLVDALGAEFRKPTTSNLVDALGAEFRKPTTSHLVKVLPIEFRKPTTGDYQEVLKEAMLTFAKDLHLAVLESTSVLCASGKCTLINIFAKDFDFLESADYFTEASEKEYSNLVDALGAEFRKPTTSVLCGSGKCSMINTIRKSFDLLESADFLMEASKTKSITYYIPSKPYNLRLISGVYDVDPRDNKGYSRVLKIEHCALQEFGNQWQLEVKCRPKGSKASSGRWTNIRNIYPDAKVKVKQNYIELTLPTVEDSHEFAVFGTPEVKDKKRMRLGIFGGKATRGQDWNIVGTLFDDTMMAFESLCEKEERKGRQLLTILPGLFISNSGEDINIDISGLEEGWKIVGNSLMTIKSKDAWNSPENSTDFPCCVFEITHVDETKQLFSCEITASHLNDSAETELVAFFEQANEVMTPPELPIQKKNVFDLFVFLQMLVFLVECFTGSSFDPQAPKKGSVVDQVESFNSN